MLITLFESNVKGRKIYEKGKKVEFHDERRVLLYPSNIILKSYFMCTRQDNMEIYTYCNYSISEVVTSCPCVLKGDTQTTVQESDEYVLFLIDIMILHVWPLWDNFSNFACHASQVIINCHMRCLNVDDESIFHMTIYILVIIKD